MFGRLKFSKESTGMMMVNTASSQLFSNVVSVIGGIICARMVMPGTYGLFNSFILYISYLPILQMGIMNALNRDFPYHLGKGEKEQAEQKAAIANCWELILGSLSGVFFLIMAIPHLLKGNISLACGYATISLSAFHLFYAVNYLQILYRTNKDFNVLAKITNIRSCMALLSIVFVWKFGFYGLCIRQVLCCLVELFLLYRWRPIKVKASFEKAIFLNMLKTGFPIHIVGIAFSYWAVINNSLVLKNGGNEQYGLFSVALIVFSALTAFGNAINQVLYPKMTFAYGGGASIKEICKLPNRYVIAVTLVSIPVIIAMWFLLPPIISLLIPNYIEGVEAAQWMTLLFIPSVLGVYNNVFNINGKQLTYLFSIIFGVGSYLLALYVLIKTTGGGLRVYPQALFLGRMIQFLFTVFFIKRYSKDTKYVI